MKTPLAMAMIVAAALAAALPAAANDGDNKLLDSAEKKLTAHGSEWMKTEVAGLTGGKTLASSVAGDAAHDCGANRLCIGGTHLSEQDQAMMMSMLALRDADRELEQRIAALRARSMQDAESAEHRQDMIRIQQLVNRRNQSYEMLTQMINKHQQTLDGIVRTMQ